MHQNDADRGKPAEEDAELLVRARTDATAFGVFYDRHAGAVLKYFASRTACTHTAADLTAETFAEALRTVHRYRPRRGIPRAWLFGIAGNVLRRFVRTSATSDRALRRLGVGPDQWDHADSIDKLVDMDRIKPLVRAGLDELSAGIRDAVQLRVIGGLPYHEVAERLSCSEGAARVRVTRGLTALADDEALVAQWTRLRLATAETMD